MITGITNQAGVTPATISASTPTSTSVSSVTSAGTTAAAGHTPATISYSPQTGGAPTLPPLPTTTLSSTGIQIYIAQKTGLPNITWSRV